MQNLHKTRADRAEKRRMGAPSQPKQRWPRPIWALLATAGMVALTGCEAMKENWARNSVFWNSPQGQMMTLQAFQQQQAFNQQNYQFEQMMLLQQQQMHMEMARSLQPIKVQQSGSIDVRVRR